jgi:hypothetical protein
LRSFEGRRRSGTILIPKGRFGQGWAWFIVELDMANSSLREGQEPRKSKEMKVALGRQSYAEVMGLSTQLEEDYFHAYKEPIAKVPSWLKEASAELEKAKKEGKLRVIYAQAVDGGVREKAPTKSHLQPKLACDSMKLAGCNQLMGITMGEVDAEIEKAPAFSTQAKAPVGITCSLFQELPKRHETAASLQTLICQYFNLPSQSEDSNFYTNF